MLDSNASPDNLLTEDESIAVDQALISAKEKFSARVAIYSLRVLKTMADEQGGDISAIAPPQILAWLAQNQPTAAEAQPGLEPDPSFSQFFAQLVLSSLKPLTQISTELEKPLYDLLPLDIIAWFEKEARIRVETGEQATFLGHE